MKYLYVIVVIIIFLAAAGWLWFWPIFLEAFTIELIRSDFDLAHILTLL